MISPSSTRSPLRILLPITASLWIGAIGLTIWASSRIATLNARSRANSDATRSLEPEIRQFDTYWRAVGDLRENPDSTPRLHEWVDNQQPTLFPTTHKEQTSTCEHSRLQMRTATATWETITVEHLQTIIETARTAPASYRLSAITLSPASRDNSLKVEAVFHAFTQ